MHQCILWWPQPLRLWNQTFFMHYLCIWLNYWRSVNLKSSFSWNFTAQKANEILDTFCPMKLGQNFVKYLVRILGNGVSRRIAFEIYWPLGWYLLITDPDQRLWEGSVDFIRIEKRYPQHDRVRTTKKKRYTQNSFKIHF